MDDQSQNPQVDMSGLDQNASVVQGDAELEALKSQVADLDYKWKRSVADYKNLEKRTIDEKISMISFANQNLLAEMLPILDNFEMLANHLDDLGLKMSINMFKQTLEKFGVKGFEVLGKDFNPSTMEAVDMVAGEKNKVCEVVLKGYLINEKLLRPARVKVGKG